MERRKSSGRSGARRRGLLPMLVIVALGATGLIPLAGCGGEQEETVIQTVTAGPAPSSAADKLAYVNTINGLVQQANDINSGYRTLIQQHDNGSISNEQLVTAAQNNVDTFQFLTSQLTSMNVPPEYLAAHQMIIASFNTWQAAYENYRDGFRNIDQTMLAQASNLDNQAVVQANQAINQINQVPI